MSCNSVKATFILFNFSSKKPLKYKIKNCLFLKPAVLDFIKTNLKKWEFLLFLAESFEMRANDLKILILKKSSAYSQVIIFF